MALENIPCGCDVRVCCGLHTFRSEQHALNNFESEIQCLLKDTNKMTKKQIVAVLKRLNNSMDCFRHDEYHTANPTRVLTIIENSN